MHKMKVTLALSALVLAALACDLTSLGGPSLPSDAEAVQRSVEATMAALASPAQGLEPTEEPIGEPALTLLEFAVQIDDAVRRGDAEFFASRLRSELRCTGLEEPPAVGSDEPTSPCLGQPAGATIRVVQSAVAESDYSVVLSAHEYALELSQWFQSAVASEADAFGGGGLALFATVEWFGGLPLVPIINEAVLTGIFPWEPMGVNMRQARIIGFMLEDGRWEITGELLATTSETAEPWLSGDCEVCYDGWEAWPGGRP